MKLVSFIVTGPPERDMGTFIAIVDETGAKVDVGWWEHDGTNWRYTMPVEMVPRLSAAIEAVIKHLPIQDEIESRHQAAIADAFNDLTGGPTEPPLSNAGMRAKQALKDRLKNTKKKETPMPAADAVPSHWEKCPSCDKPFDPAKDELMECGTCSESKCTRECLPDPTRPCVDCQALTPDKGDGAFDPSATPPGVFNKGFTEATRMKAEADGTLPDDDDAGDEE